MKVKVISLPYIFQVLYVLCFTRPRYQVSVYRTIGHLVFSWHKENSLSNHLLVVAKYYIYKTKFTSRQLSMAGFKQLLERKFEGEKYIAKINNKYEKCLSKWSALYGSETHLREVPICVKSRFVTS